jgi:hypothetical protein
MAAQDEAFDEVSEEVVATIPAFAEAGVHEVCVQATDAAGNTSDPQCVLLAVYDPDGGFVTGGGWIDSLADAYVDDPSLEGKANFGFVSKYKKGASTPTGTTEFQFKAGDLNFHSNTYQWLVVNQGGDNAQFKGVGTINGQLDSRDQPYGFMLWAGDGESDTFRIRIWSEWEGVETDVYDNGVNQTIGGGSIVIHRK